MAIIVKFRRGSTSESNSFLGDEGELYIDKDKDTIVVHDGTTVGGFPLASEAWVTQAIANFGTSSFSGNYNDLTNKPILFSGNYNDLSNTPVLFSGSYNDLSDKPVLFSGNYNDLTNQPVLFSGSYNDLSNLPNLVKAAVEWSPNHTLASGTRYLVGDVVWDNGNIYIANYDNESLPTSNTLYWTNLGPGNRLNIDGRDIPNIDGRDISNISYNQLGDLPVGLATETYVNTQVANLVNASPTTLDTLNELAAALGDDPNFATTVSNQIGLKANTADLATVATSGSYNDLSNKPTAVSTFTNDANYITSQLTSNLNVDAYSLVGGNYSGSYVRFPVGGGAIIGSTYDGNVYVQTGSGGIVTKTWQYKPNGDILFPDNTIQTTAWTGNIAYGNVTGTPSLATVATSGSYNDLTNKPTIPTVPTAVSAFTNDANYASQSYVTTQVSNLSTVYQPLNSNLTALSTNGFGTTANTIPRYDANAWLTIGANWKVKEVSGVLFFAHNGVNKMKIDSSGNLTVTGDITAFGTV